MVASLMHRLNPNLRCSHTFGWQTLINTKLASTLPCTDYPRVTVCEGLVSNRQRLNFCRNCFLKIQLQLALNTWVYLLRYQYQTIYTSTESILQRERKNISFRKSVLKSAITWLPMKNFPCQCLRCLAFQVPLLLINRRAASCFSARIFLQSKNYGFTAQQQQSLSRAPSYTSNQLSTIHLWTVSLPSFLAQKGCVFVALSLPSIYKKISNAHHTEEIP